MTTTQKRNEGLLSTIRQYHKAGYVITPLNGKAPTRKNWHKTTLQQSKDQLDNGDFNNCQSAGFVIPDNLIIVDVDNHATGGENLGDKNLKLLSEKYDFDLISNAAVITNTASGGKHLYYKKKDKYLDLPVSNVLRDSPSVEFKSIKRQVVIAGSILPNGKEYSLSLLTRGFKEMAYLPDEMMHAILSKENGIKLAPDAPEREVLVPKDSVADIKAFQEILSYQEVNLEGNRSDNTYRLACIGKDQGLSKQKVTDLLSPYNLTHNQPPLSSQVLHSTITHAFTYSKNTGPSRSIAADFPPIKKDQLDNGENLNDEEARVQQEELAPWTEQLIRSGKDGTGAVSRANFGTQNTTVYLKNLPQFKDKIAVNLFSMDTIWKQPAPWHKKDNSGSDSDRVLDDDDLIRMKAELNKAGFDPSTQVILEASRSVSLDNEYHPVKEYFNELPEWDGVNRLERFFPDYCSTVDDKYTQALGVKIFTAIVARIFVPGIKFDYLPIFIGEQGIGKSTLLETIAIKPQWYTDNLGDVNNKDVILRMRSKLIVENAELTMFNNADVNEVKAFLSRRTDRDRLPYDRLPRDLHRQCIIVATTNKDRFLQDETGNRRMWPVEIIKINSNLIKKALPLFYAEAIARFKRGEQLFLDDEAANAIATLKQAERYNDDDWEPTVAAWLEDNGIGKIIISTIWEECFGKDIVSCGFREQRRIGSILRHLGWKRTTISYNGKITTGFKK
jgi:predicted P-loop ATPase